MPYCRNCGAFLSEEAKFCTECGTRQLTLNPGDPVAPPAEEPVPEPSVTPTPLDALSSRPWDPERPGGVRKTARIIGAVFILLLAVAAVLLSVSGRGRSSAPAVSDVQISGVAVERSTASLKTGTQWYGFLDISNHKGNGSLKDGSMEVWGLLDTASDGTPYFELYEDEEVNEDSTPILSMWVELHDDRLVPVIGREDAWLFNIWLDAQDAEPLTLYLNSGMLSADYNYYDGYERCDISFAVVQVRD